MILMIRMVFQRHCDQQGHNNIFFSYSNHYVESPAMSVRTLYYDSTYVRSIISLLRSWGCQILSLTEKTGTI